MSNWTNNRISITICMRFQAPIEGVGVKFLNRQLLTILELDKKINDGTVSKPTKLLSRIFGEVFNCREKARLLVNELSNLSNIFSRARKSCVFCVCIMLRL
jgi:nicotinate-nucleotide pyrophosphorylase